MGMCACMCLCMHVFVCSVCVCMHVFVCVCVRACMCVFKLFMYIKRTPVFLHFFVQIYSLSFLTKTSLCKKVRRGYYPAHCETMLELTA